MAYSFPDLTSALAVFQRAGLAISPWLAGVSQSGRFDPGVFEILDTAAREYAAVHWTEDIQFQTFGDLPIPERLPRTAMYEVLASTAIFTAHERVGKLIVDEDMAQEAIRLVEHFAKTEGFALLVEIYSLIASYENQSALAYYGNIPEKAFLNGSWHRPWIDYSLNDEFLLGALSGNYHVVARDGRRFAELTEGGRLALQRTKEMLKELGYLAQRVRLLHISQFGLYVDYEYLVQQTWPDLMSLRRKFLDWTDIQPGMKVLEVGCGSGALTLDAGLVERVGPLGHVTAVDPSIGMLSRARLKADNSSLGTVNFLQARAEELPFPDGTFDAVVGFAYLHLTELPAAMREMRRVTLPNGFIASAHPLKAPLDLPFFAEWFSPILDIAARRNEPPKEYLLRQDEAGQALSTAGLMEIEKQESSYISLFSDPDQVIRHFIHGVGWFQEELADLPWKARMEVIEALRAKGEDVCRRFPAEHRVFTSPLEMVKGRVP